ncbi:hypothetical protein [Chryseobacterium sp. Mn2064]|uniref:hypothetical protein n=1 Tax=Chryseobacterium sp. Mn2064 TaxID=3395263 RepID=UPI003BD8F607
MKNNIITGVLLLGSFTISHAQQGSVGINTSTPKSTLDVNGKKDAGGVLLTTDITGLQAPRLTRLELTNKGNTLYGVDQKGALVYITDVSTGTAASQRANITSIGYYYFDGALWQKLIDAPVNIYNSDGSLTGAGTTRTLNLNSKNMNFVGSDQRTTWNSSGALSQTNLATSGSASLLLNGGNSAQLSVQQFSGADAQIFTVGGSTSLVIGTHATATATPIRFVTSAGSNALGTEKARITGDGKFGIGTNSPSTTLDIEGTMRLSQSVTANIPANTGTTVTPLMIDRATGKVIIAPKGVPSVSGGFRPGGTNTLVTTLPLNNTIVRVSFVCHIDGSNELNNSDATDYHYGDIDIVGLGSANPIKFVRNEIRGADGAVKTVTMTDTNITIPGGIQGNVALNLNPTNGELRISSQLSMSYVFEFLGGL